jgi:predicted transcriptional regulator
MSGFSRQFLKDLLKERKLKGKHAAELLGITPAAVSQVLTGAREPSPSIEAKLKEHFPECFISREQAPG